MKKDSKIFVICGGFSSEREVSLRSGFNVHQALLRLGFVNAKLLDLDSLQAMGALLQLKIDNQIDFAYLLTHGTYGEDGCLQGFLDLLQIPYLGSGLEASAICMNKTLCKQILKAADLPVLETYELSDDLPKNSPLILKPRSGGSSIGVLKFNSSAELKSCVKSISDPENYFVEIFNKGREITTSIVQIEASKITKNSNKIYTKNNLVSLPLLELRPLNEFYDYQAKYTKGMTEFLLPAQIDQDLELQIHELAIKAFQAVGSRSMSRVDFILGENNQIIILEVNTLPGMTDTSDLPAQALAAGITYDDLILNLLDSYYAKASF